MVLSRDDGSRIDLHLVERSTGGMTQRLPGGKQFTYVLDDTTGVIDGRTVPCLSPEMQLLTHSGYEPDDDDRADVALVAAASGRALPPPYADALAARPSRSPFALQPWTTCAAACIVRMRSWRAAYAGLMPQPVIDALDLGTMWSTWRASVQRARRPPRCDCSWPDRPARCMRTRGSVRPTAAAEQQRWRRCTATRRCGGPRPVGPRSRRGVGFLREQGYTELSLWMLKGNERAGRFYERAGWFPDGEEQDDEHGGRVVRGSAVPARRVVAVAVADADEFGNFADLYDERTLGRLERTERQQVPAEVARGWRVGLGAGVIATTAMIGVRDVIEPERRDPVIEEVDLTGLHDPDAAGRVPPRPRCTEGQPRHRPPLAPLTLDLVPSDSNVGWKRAPWRPFLPGVRDAGGVGAVHCHTPSA